jgi:hypothetical protein
MLEVRVTFSKSPIRPKTSPRAEFGRQARTT